MDDDITKQMVVDLLDAEYRKEIDRKLAELAQLEADYQQFRQTVEHEYTVNGVLHSFKR